MGKIDWDGMPHHEMVSELRDGTAVRDKRIRELTGATATPSPRGRPKNGAPEAPSGDMDGEALS